MKYFKTILRGKECYFQGKSKETVFDELIKSEIFKVNSFVLTLTSEISFDTETLSEDIIFFFYGEEDDGLIVKDVNNLIISKLKDEFEYEQYYDDTILIPEDEEGLIKIIDNVLLIIKNNLSEGYCNSMDFNLRDITEKEYKNNLIKDNFR
ncbi:hypothetical protein CPT_Machias_031 [Staphylococcus phage Machias]|nr:hypothetical protein CPT_Machias_031 [Staphylococcus phage Machias]